MVTELRDWQVSLCHHPFQITLYDKRCYASLPNSFFTKVNAMEYLRHMHALPGTHSMDWYSSYLTYFYVVRLNILPNELG